MPCSLRVSDTASWAGWEPQRGLFPLSARQGPLGLHGLWGQLSEFAYVGGV